MIAEILLLSKLHLQKPNSKTLVSSKLKVTLSKYHAVKTYPFSFNSNNPPMPEIQLFWILNFCINRYNGNVMDEVTVQVYIVGLASYSLTPMLFYALFLRWGYFQIWPWKFMVKFMGYAKIQGHRVGPATYRPTYFFTACKSTVQFPSYNYFKSWPWKSELTVKVTQLTQHPFDALSFLSWLAEWFTILGT